jgi:hypothetical protein
MIPPFDIFKRLGGGSVRWVGVVTDLEAAKARVKELVATSPGEYFIFSLAAGHRLHIKSDDPDANSRSIEGKARLRDTKEGPHAQCRSDLQSV